MTKEQTKRIMDALRAIRSNIGNDNETARELCTAVRVWIDAMGFPGEKFAEADVDDYIDRSMRATK